MTKYTKVRKNPAPLILPALEFTIPLIVGGLTYLITQSTGGQPTHAKPPSFDSENFRKLVKEIMEEHGDNYFLEQPKDLFYLDKPLEYVNTKQMLGYSARAKTIYIGENVGEWNRWTRNVKDVEWYLHQYTKPLSNNAFKDAIGPLNFLYFSKKKINFAPWIGLALDAVADQDVPKDGTWEQRYSFSVPKLSLSGPNTDASGISQPPSYYQALRVSKAQNRRKIAKMLRISDQNTDVLYNSFVPRIFDKKAKRLIAFYLKFVVFKTRAYWRERYNSFCEGLDAKYGLTVPFFADRYTTTFSKPSTDEYTHYRLLISDILSASPASNFDSNSPIGFDPDVYPESLKNPSIEDIQRVIASRKGDSELPPMEYVRVEVKGFRSIYKQILFNIRKNLYPIDELRICSGAMWVFMQKFEKIAKERKVGPEVCVTSGSSFIQDVIEELFKDIGLGYLFKKIGASAFFNFVVATDSVGLLPTYQFLQTYVPEVVDYLALGFLKTTPGYTIDEKYIHFAELFLDGAFCCEVENRDSLFIDSSNPDPEAVANLKDSSFVSGAVFYKKG